MAEKQEQCSLESILEFVHFNKADNHLGFCTLFILCCGPTPDGGTRSNMADKSLQIPNGFSLYVYLSLVNK